MKTATTRQKDKHSVSKIKTDLSPLSEHPTCQGGKIIKTLGSNIDLKDIFFLLKEIKRVPQYWENRRVNNVISGKKPPSKRHCLDVDKFAMFSGGWTWQKGLSRFGSPFREKIERIKKGKRSKRLGGNIIIGCRDKISLQD